MTHPTIRNGVNVDELMTAIEAVKTDPQNGALTFTVKTRWEDGFKATHTTAGFVVGTENGVRENNHTITTDEPHEVLGTDAGISPAETLITSLAACLSVGYAANAAVKGIKLDELTFEITGYGSLEGFMNIGDKRAGLTNLKIRTTIKSDATKEEINELHDYVNEHSPIWDTIANPVGISSEFVCS